MVSDDIKLAIEVVTFGIAVGAIVWRTSNMATRFESIGERQAAEITQLKVAVEALGQLRINDASDRERMNAQDQRSLMQGQRIDENMKVAGARMDDLSRRIDDIRREFRETVNKRLP